MDKDDPRHAPTSDGTVVSTLGRRAHRHDDFGCEMMVYQSHGRRRDLSAPSKWPISTSKAPRPEGF
jgi:hypothetical protein